MNSALALKLSALKYLVADQKESAFLVMLVTLSGSKRFGELTTENVCPGRFPSSRVIIALGAK